MKISDLYFQKFYWAQKNQNIKQVDLTCLLLLYPYPRAKNYFCAKKNMMQKWSEGV
jgi:hypothetical protein